MARRLLLGGLDSFVADYTIIAEVSETLRTALHNALQALSPPATAEVHDLQGNISTSPARITVFLYEVVEDPSTRNRPAGRRVDPMTNDVVTQKTPLKLVLRYLLTPWGADRRTDQIILARALQVLYDDAILSGPQVTARLQITNEVLKVTLTPLTLEERTRVWHSVQKPYRLSVAYEVRVINLDAIEEETLTPVSERGLDFAEAGA